MAKPADDDMTLKVLDYLYDEGYQPPSKKLKKPKEGMAVPVEGKEGEQSAAEQGQNPENFLNLSRQFK